MRGVLALAVLEMLLLAIRIAKENEPHPWAGSPAT